MDLNSLFYIQIHFYFIYTKIEGFLRLIIEDYIYKLK